MTWQTKLALHIDSMQSEESMHSIYLSYNSPFVPPSKWHLHVVERRHILIGGQWVRARKVLDRLRKSYCVHQTTFLVLVKVFYYLFHFMEGILIIRKPISPSKYTMWFHYTSTYSRLSNEAERAEPKQRPVNSSSLSRFGILAVCFIAGMLGFFTA